MPVPPDPARKQLLLIGASRGLGLALAEAYMRRGWRVVGTVRGAGRTLLHKLADTAQDALEIEQLDIDIPDQVAALRHRLAARRFDLLFVNAGVTNDPEATIGEVSTEEFLRVMVTNALSPMRIIEQFQDLVPATGTIGVMSSSLASIAGNDYGSWEVYRASKAALNMLLRSFAARRIGDARTLLAIDPGWVRTDMGGPEADLGIADSIPNVVKTISAASGKPGLHFLDYRGRTLPW
jgi:NAD(P)-dependent dehydrogenase (short-subunit alcohol dehydrogenase family)